MEYMLNILDMIGTVAFAISGAMTAIRKRMDILGVMILGMVTAVGGGMIRDIVLGYLWSEERAAYQDYLLPN